MKVNSLSKRNAVVTVTVLTVLLLITSLFIAGVVGESKAEGTPPKTTVAVPAEPAPVPSLAPDASVSGAPSAPASTTPPAPVAPTATPTAVPPTAPAAPGAAPRTQMSVPALPAVRGKFREATPSTPVCEPLTAETAKEIVATNIWWPDPRNPEQKFLDALLVNHDPLNPDADDDGDGLLNKEEICTYLNGKTDPKTGKPLRSLRYKSHPLLADTDGDGIKDKEDTHPLSWDVSARDAIMFQELSYRNADYVRKVLDNTTEFLRSDWHKDRAEYQVFHNELSPYWEVQKVWDESDGFDATLFKFSNKTLPFLEDDSAHVLGVRGTGGDGGNDGDLANDVRLGLGLWPWQADTALNVADELTAAGYRNLSIAGHSLGGYLTQIITARMIGQRFADRPNNPNNENYNQFDKNKKNNPNFVKSYTFNAPGMGGWRWLWEYRELGKVIGQKGLATNYKTNNDSVPGNLEPTTWLPKSDGGHSSRSFMEPKFYDQPGFSVGDRRGFQQGEGRPNNPDLEKAAVFVKPTLIQFVTVEPDGSKKVRKELIYAKTQDELNALHLNFPPELLSDYQQILDRPPLKYGETNQIVAELKKFNVTYEFQADDAPVGAAQTVEAKKYGDPYQTPALPDSGSPDWAYEIESVAAIRTDTNVAVDDWLRSVTASQPVATTVPQVDTAKLDAPVKVLVKLVKKDTRKELKLVFKDSSGNIVGRYSRKVTAEEARNLVLQEEWVPMGYHIVSSSQVLSLEQENEIGVVPVGEGSLPKTGSSAFLLINLVGIVLVGLALFLVRMEPQKFDQYIVMLRHRIQRATK